MAVFKKTFKKAVELFVKNGSCFFRLFIAFSIPLVLMYIYFWDDQELIGKIIDRLTLPGFVLLDDAINCAVGIYFILYLVAVVQSAQAATQGSHSGVIASYRKALSIFGPYLWVKILSLFKMLCWSLLFIIPGVITGVLYNFSGMAFLVDGKCGGEALARSKKIIKLNIKEYLLNYFFITISSIIVGTLIKLNLDSVITLLRLNGNGFLFGTVICLEVALGALVLSFFLTFYYCLYTVLGEGVED